MGFASVFHHGVRIPANFDPGLPTVSHRISAAKFSALHSHASRFHSGLYLSPLLHRYFVYPWNIGVCNFLPLNGFLWQFIILVDLILFRFCAPKGLTMMMIYQPQVTNCPTLQ